MWQDRGHVFANEVGAPIGAVVDWTEWKTILRIAGLRDARLHDARHTAATLLLTQGVSARVVMQILGHSQISLTLGTYSQVMPELARDAADRIGAALWGVSEGPADPNGHGMAPRPHLTLRPQTTLGQ